MAEILKSRWNLNPLSKDFCIVDIEISNDISNGVNGKWDYDKAEISVCGFLVGRSIVQVVRGDSDAEFEYELAVERQLRSFASKGASFYAFNWRMEHGGLNSLLKKVNGFSLRYVGEVKPFNGKGWTLGRFYGELLEGKKIRAVPDVLEFQSNKCIELWNSKLEKSRDLVLKHNISDLKREAYVLHFREFLKEGRKIDKNGWIQ